MRERASSSVLIGRTVAIKRERLMVCSASPCFLTVKYLSSMALHRLFSYIISINQMKTKVNSFITPLLHKGKNITKRLRKL